MNEEYSNDHEFRKSVGRLAASFDRWWSQQPPSDLTLNTVSEIVAHVYCYVRMYLSEEQTVHMLVEAMRWTERYIQNGDLELELPDGSRYPYRSAEAYEGQEELRDMLIATSRGSTFTDDAINKFLDDADGMA